MFVAALLLASTLTTDAPSTDLLPDGCSSFDTATLQSRIGASYLLSKGSYQVDRPDEGYAHRSCRYKAGFGEKAAEFQIFVTRSNEVRGSIAKFRKEGWGLDHLPVQAVSEMANAAVLAEWTNRAGTKKRALLWEVDSHLFQIELVDSNTAKLDMETTIKLADLVTQSILHS